MKTMKIYYILWKHAFNGNLQDEDGNDLPEIERCFESQIVMMTVDHKKAENYLKEIMRSVRSHSTYEERVQSEKYYPDHYIIYYNDEEEEKYDICWNHIVIPDKEEELA